MSAGMEIERKFLVGEPPPEALAAPSTPIAQGYLAVGDRTEVRLRRRGEVLLETVKSLGDLVRREHEVELTAEQFEALWPATEGARVEKVRHVLPQGGLTFEVDVYQGRLAGLVTVEVEFVNEAASRAFVPPPWFGPEVTSDARYKNRNLALHGRPQRLEHGGG